MARGRSEPSIGHKAPATSKYAFGDPEEIANRDKAGYQPHPTSFKQISPEGHGGNMNEPPHTVKSGVFKFSPPVD